MVNVFQRFHLSALLSLDCVVCERGAQHLNWHFKTYRHFNTSGRRGLQCENKCVCLCAFVCECICVSDYIPPRGLVSQLPSQYITPDIINVQFEGERKWNVSLPANMLCPVSRLLSDLCELREQGRGQNEKIGEVHSIQRQ